MAPFLVLELRLWLLPPDSPFWGASSPEGLGWLYWAFAWPGGQALARHLLDRPELVRGRRVLAFGAGGGIEAVAAARAGARSVRCTDLDAIACQLAQRNAALNAVTLETHLGDVVGDAVDADVLLVADACYEPALAARVFPWLLAQARRGVTVLVGDPGRVARPRDVCTEALGRYDAAFDGDPRGTTRWGTDVFRVLPLTP